MSGEVAALTPEEVLNLRDLEGERISKTSEKLMDSIAEENYRLVRSYKEALNKRMDKWEQYHLQYANLKNLGVGDSDLKSDHQKMLGVTEHADSAAEKFYLALKQKRREEKRAERAAKESEQREEKEKKAKADAEAKKPILKNFVISELKEINKILLSESQSISVKQKNKQPDPQVLSNQLEYLEKRFETALNSYSEFVSLSTDTKELDSLRDLKNIEERKYRTEIVKVQSFIAKNAPTIQIKGNPQNKTTTTLKPRATAGIPTELGTDRMTNQKEIMKAFPDMVTSLSLDETHILGGLYSGVVACYISKMKKEKFVTEPLTNVPITAVLCDRFDTQGKNLFYAGDIKGNLYVMGERGNLIDSIKARDGPIFAIQDVEARKVWVYSDMGKSVVTLSGDKLTIQAKQNSKASMGLDGTVYNSRKKGEFPLEAVMADVPCRVYGSPRIMMEKVNDEYIDVTVYTTDSERFKRDLVEDKNAQPNLQIAGRGNAVIRTLELGSPVKQVLNLYAKNPKGRRDAVYILTCDDKITRFKATELYDENIDDDSLEKVLVFESDDDEADNEDLGDIEEFTARVDDSDAGSVNVLFIMRDSEEMYIVKDAVDAP